MRRSLKECLKKNKLNILHVPDVANVVQLDKVTPQKIREGTLWCAKMNAKTPTNSWMKFTQRRSISENKKRKQSDLTQSGFNVPKKYEGILKRENSSVDNKENIDPIAFTNLIKTMRDKQVLLDSLILKCEQEYERIMKGVNN